MRNPIFKILIGIALLLIPISASATTLGTQQGGTGTSSPSGILFGNNNATPLSTLTIGSNLTLTGSTLSATGGSSSVVLATTSPWNALSLVQVVDNGHVTSIATSSLNLTTSAFKSANISQWTNDSGYLTGNQTITLSGAVSGSGATSITTSYAGTLGNTLGGTGQNSSAWTGLAGISGGAWYPISTSTAVNLNISGNSGTATALQNARTINSVSFNGTSNIVITAASSSILGDNNTFSGQDVFSNASTTLLTITTGWLPSLGTPAGTFLAADPNGKIIATTTPTGGSSGAVSIPVQLATTGALPANTYAGGVLTEVGTGALTVDGTSAAVGNRILVKNEAAQTNNGIYSVTAAGSGIAAYVLTRVSDYNSSTNVIPGEATYVIGGATLNDDWWALTTVAPITVGGGGSGSNLTYVESGTGASGVTSVTGTWPITSSGGTTPNIIWSGIASSTNLVTSDLWYSTGVNTYGQVATSSLGITSPITFSGTLGAQVGGTGGNFACATCDTFAFPWTNGSYNSQTANSTSTLIWLKGSPLALAASTSALTYASSTAITDEFLFSPTGDELIFNNLQLTPSSGMSLGTPMAPWKSLTSTLGTITDASTTAFSSSNLTSGDCVQASTGGLLVSAAAACGVGTVTSVTATAPIFSTGGTTPVINWAGLATTTNLVAAQVLFATSASGVGGNTAFTFSTTGNTLLTVTNASTTNLTVGTYFQTAGMLDTASSTIGGGSITTGLTVNGGATTTDEDNAWVGITTPTHNIGLAAATTTTWTATTTGPYVPYWILRSAGTLKNVVCASTTTASFLGIQFYLGGTAVTPYLVASTTEGTTTFTANNTFLAGAILSMYAGTGTASTANQGVSCTINYVQTS